MGIFKLGDIVIKKTGGNKMVISQIIGKKCVCVWFLDSDKYEDFFYINELILFKDYMRVMETLEIRENIIDDIINGNEHT